MTASCAAIFCLFLFCSSLFLSFSLGLVVVAKADTADALGQGFEIIVAFKLLVYCHPEVWIPFALSLSVINVMFLLPCLSLFFSFLNWNKSREMSVCFVIPFFSELLPKSASTFPCNPGTISVCWICPCYNYVRFGWVWHLNCKAIHKGWSMNADIFWVWDYSSVLTAWDVLAVCGLVQLKLGYSWVHVGKLEAGNPSDRVNAGIQMLVGPPPPKKKKKKKKEKKKREAHKNK